MKLAVPNELVAKLLAESIDNFGAGVLSAIGAFGFGIIGVARTVSPGFQ